MTLNNLSARLIVNQWLEQNGLDALPAELSYIDFATELRKKVAPRQVQAPFTEKSDAVAYVRLMARMLPARTASRARANRVTPRE